MAISDPIVQSKQQRRSRCQKPSLILKARPIRKIRACFLVYRFLSVPQGKCKDTSVDTDANDLSFDHYYQIDSADCGTSCFYLGSSYEKYTSKLLFFSTSTTKNNYSETMVRTVNLVSNVCDLKCVSLSMMVNGQKCLVMIDTGSTISCISTRLVKTLKAIIIYADKNDGPIQSAHANITVPRIGATVPLALDTSEKVVVHECEVSDMPHGYDLLIGLDTFFIFGFGVLII